MNNPNDSAERLIPIDLNERDQLLLTTRDVLSMDQMANMKKTLDAQFASDGKILFVSGVDQAIVIRRESVTDASPHPDQYLYLKTRELVRFILKNSIMFEWSIQGLGMLRLYLDDNTRLHVWDPRFEYPRVSKVHDHQQWGLESTIISGKLTNYKYVEADDGEDYLYTTLKAGMGCYFKHDPIPTRLKLSEADVYVGGMTYTQEPHEIHCTLARMGTVTIMTKTPANDGESARVFWAADTQWGTAEPRKATLEQVREITATALRLMNEEEAEDV